MFTELNAHIGNSESDNPGKGDFYLVTEASGSDGSFIIHHFLTQYLKTNRRVVFLGLAQSFSHYNAVAQKLGVNLMTAKTSGQLDFISGLQYSFPLMRDEGSAQKHTSEDAILLGCIRSKSLQPLYKCLQGSLQKKTGEQAHLRTLLVIDDIGILYSLGIDTNQIADFMQYCQSSMFGQDKEHAGSVVSLLHCDENDDEEILSLSSQLQHACTCHLRVEGLPSGFSKDVHGQLSIVRKSLNMDHCRTGKKMLQFKITDKNASFFPAGTSSAVL